MARTTRSATARQAAFLAAEIENLTQMHGMELDSLLQVSGRVTRSRAATLRQEKHTAAPTVNTSNDHPQKKQKPKKRNNAPKPSDANELPHNLGSVITVSSKATAGQSSTSHQNLAAEKENIVVLAVELQTTVNKATETLAEPAATETRKGAKKSNPYGLTPGGTPFPYWIHPTPEQCEEVNRLLSSVHGEVVAPTTIPQPSLTVTGCGEVPSVLDALIRTLLSGATSGRNSALAFSGLVQKFGILDEGIGKGSVNWDAVRRAPVKDVFEAIKSGGLADIKSKNLKAILDMVYKENQERRDMLVRAKDEEDKPPPSVSESESEKAYEIACADQNFLSLNHLHSLDTEQAMTELVKYPGIGPKTAACVLLFCLQRPCFAVDTHVFRICKWLNWVPPDKATEISAFSHLEVRVPDHLKYSLHQLFIRHGKSCPRCRAITGQSAAGWEDGCVIDRLVTRTGKRKGASGSENGSSKRKRKSK